MVSMENVSLKIKDRIILDSICLEAGMGEAVGLVGGNGCGKTMAMKCICGFYRRFSGEIRVLGKRIGKEAEFPPETGFIIETPGFIPYLSGYENLKLLADVKKLIGREEVERHMELVGLDPKEKKSVRKYSLGMRQRLGIAQALMEDPKVLILDEPFNGLDKGMAAKVRDVLLAEKEKGKTILLASHNEKDIAYLCDRTYELDAGKIVGERETWEMA